MAWLNGNLGDLNDPLIWQPIYVKYGIIDMNAGKDYSAGSNYKYLGLTITPDVLDELGKATPQSYLNAATNQAGMEALVAWQVNWLNQREPFKTAFAAKNILLPSTVSGGQPQPEGLVSKPFDWMNILLIGGLGLGGYLLYTKYSKKSGGVSYGTT